jgi:cbb3-type cytochrome oxidase subunit 3
MTMSRTKIFTFMVAALFFGAVIWWAFPKSTEGENPRSRESLNKLAVQINRAVPVMIDKETELLAAAGTEGMLTYNYRLVSYSVSQLDAAKFAKGAKDRVTQGACNRPETRDDLLKQGVTLRYAYFDRDKQHIATIDVLPADCAS